MPFSASITRISAADFWLPPKRTARLRIRLISWGSILSPVCVNNWNIDADEYTREIELPVTGEYTLITKTVDEECCNPLKVWHDMGEPAHPTKAETDLIRSSAFPLIRSAVVKDTDGKAEISVPVKKNGVVYFELSERIFTPDRGYDYERVISDH